MEFRNLTPFSAMEYAMDDTRGKRYHVIAIKTGFRLVQDADGQWQTMLMEYPALPLSVEDKFSGEMNASPVVHESDLAPLKPACDMIVNGTAHTPDGTAIPEMSVKPRWAPPRPPSLILSPPAWVMRCRLSRQSKRTDIRCWYWIKVSFPRQKAMGRVWLRE